MFGYDERLLALRRKGIILHWSDIVRLLAARGIKVHASHLYNMKNGILRTPKANLVLAACDEIISEFEKSAAERKNVV